MIIKININDIFKSSYNPRKRIGARFELVKLSLSKLGFLSPIIADKKGEILSGHQRLDAAKALGFESVPVMYLDFEDESQRRAMNIVFNRATNDLSAGATVTSMTKELGSIDLHEIAKTLPDEADYLKCLNLTPVSAGVLKHANSGRWVNYAYQMAKTLRHKGIILPIICTADNVVVNGIGRLQMLLEKKVKSVNVVYIKNEQAVFASAMLNLLSMEFDMEETYKDQLRFNSFRRATTTRAGLGKGFYVHAFGNVSTKVFCLNKNVKKWKKQYGSTIIDFGAGKFTDTDILRGVGINVTPFEPYPLKYGTDAVEPERGRKVARAFLDEVASGKKFDSIFISSVLNSVPFRKDREMIAIICAAILGERGQVFAWTMGINHSNITTLKVENRNERSAGVKQFRLDYEGGILLGNLSSTPKAQKFHTGEELYDTFKVAFEKVSVKKITDSLACTAKKSIINNAMLRQALEFEFDLPYPDGSTMGLVDYAINAFEKRLNTKL